MLKMIKGCKIYGLNKLQEHYEINGFTMRANVNADKIREVIQHFIFSQTSLLFFVLELPSNEIDEKRLRKCDYDSMHKDIYYIDGLSKEEILTLITNYGDLLINDGLSGFGFGSHDNTAEIMVDKYNVVTLWTHNMEKYDGFFEQHNINRTDKLVTAWDTFNDDTPGESFCFEVDGKNVFCLIDELKDWGIYFAKQREG
ncbi:hypothetical protein [Aminipila luticellarii]|uniref:Uncharacterized protein n=1 Tax=Aminipila luticellarii TaxID=2507160 RepID=A0A410PU46_9FIRM|nr:hypothetical protein [Aminipila luticellarii]QAT42434.1 hypothetical protein EQM06_03875 [Aminipila luticellarii]